MKKYFVEAHKKQLEKPTEPYYINCATAKCWVIAENEAEALELGCKKLHAENDGTGVVLGKPFVTKCVDLPVDWSYGYGDERKSGDTASIGDLVGNYVIR